MSEKRFGYGETDLFEWVEDNGKMISTKECVNKLNEQDKEIGLLRLELDTHKHPLWSTREAERKVNKLADSLADEVKKNGVLDEEINQLRIENMRLKEENEKLRQLYKVYEKAEEVEEKAKDCLIQELKKENEQLRKNFDDLTKWASEISKRNVVLDEQNGQLQRKNEQLRQTIIEMRQDEQLYAREIVKLNKEVKDNQFLRLGNDY